MTRRTGVLAAIAALLTGCSATGALNALTANNTYTVREGVAYGSGPREKLDIYHPAVKTAGLPPVVVFFYGGNWKSGERADYQFVGEALASRGAIVVIPDYRLYPEVTYPGFLEDSAAATKWVLDNAQSLGGDPARIHVMGHSAGAYNAAMMALDPRWLGARRERLAGFIGLAGPYDFLPIENPDTRKAFNWPNTPPESQPIRYVTAKAPRSLLIAPENDNLVNPQRNTVGLGNRLKAAGVEAKVLVLPKVSHVTLVGALAGPLRFLGPVRDEVTGFLGLPVDPGK